MLNVSAELPLFDQRLSGRSPDLIESLADFVRHFDSAPCMVKVDVSVRYTVLAHPNFDS